MKFTNNELIIIEFILGKVSDNLSYDSEEKEYRENHEDFILSLSKSEKATVTRILNKIA